VIDDIFETLNDRYYALGIFLDLFKAFDTLNHEKLLAKLQHHGIPYVALLVSTGLLCQVLGPLHLYYGAP